jgi:hypothetical protein
MAVSRHPLRDSADSGQDSSFMATIAERLLLADFAVPEVKRVLAALNSSSGLQCPVRPSRDLTGEGFSFSDHAPKSGDVENSFANEHGSSIGG